MYSTVLDVEILRSKQFYSRFAKFLNGRAVDLIVKAILVYVIITFEKFTLLGDLPGQ